MLGISHRISCIGRIRLRRSHQRVGLPQPLAGDAAVIELVLVARPRLTSGGLREVLRLGVRAKVAAVAVGSGEGVAVRAALAAVL